MNNNKKVLVIEDDHGVANMLRAIMRFGTVDAVFADTGRKGIDMLNPDEIGMVICDIMLPDILGYDILKHLKNDDATRNIPFVFLTAFADPADVKRGIDAGADRYITKPFAARNILDTVKEFMAA